MFTQTLLSVQSIIIQVVLESKNSTCIDGIGYIIIQWNLVHTDTNGKYAMKYILKKIFWTDDFLVFY